ncbi:MAG: aldo/keto reductase [Candidatus Omnitrophota bacterium]
MDRRTFLECCGGLAAWASPNRGDGFGLLRPLGATGVKVSLLGLGTANLHRLEANAAERLIRHAHSLGFAYFDSAAAYGDGVSESILGKCLDRSQEHLFIASKTLRRRDAAPDLYASLRRLRFERIDLWMMHDLRTPWEWEEMTAPGGALETALRARENGDIRFIGLSAHRHPDLIAKALHEFPFDAIMIPLKPASSGGEGFVEKVIPLANRMGVGVVGMKIFGRSAPRNLSSEAAMQAWREAARYPAASIVAGCETVEQLQLAADAFSVPIA